MKRWIIILLSVAGYWSCQKDDGSGIVLRPDVAFSEFTDDRDSNVYKCITIGNQTWMAENLRYRLPMGSLNGCLTYDEVLIKSISDADVMVEFNAMKLYVELNDSIQKYSKTVPGMAGIYMSMFFGDLVNPREERRKSYSQVVEGLKTMGVWDDLFTPYQEQLNSFYDAVYSKAQRITVVKLAALNTDYGYVKEYGYLYWHAALASIVPQGWRIPDDEDWKELEKNLGMSAGELDLKEEWRGAGVGTLLKEGGIGFDAKLSGVRVFGAGAEVSTFMKKGLVASFWSSTLTAVSDSTNLGIIRSVSLQNDGVLRGTSKLTDRTQMGVPAYSVRCIKEQAR